ncbi:hypothetical protein COM04_08640 [Bacillus wiedmannii]|uniref:hypothetical protein n=1 Tax=Bacillus wiedmannii TaxID=1890302 RepID=UPI000BF9B67F|nr:hypothetical protein [Bacillus wiedmannii]PEP76961.1 hypothetical protein CN573_05375 [Bacillus wiedmannii]PGB98155.1 hypothetical protein COM04_08640 [Bacillus wiedmannii]PHE04718.1 hypothetical protein COF56_11545 [Bacillus wiedmannii]
MKLVKFFSQPLLLAIVWLIGIRPATYIIDHFFSNKEIPLTVKGTIDIALLSSLTAYIISLWKPPIELETKLINMETRRAHSNCKKTNVEVTLKISLEIVIKVKNGNWINWSKMARKFGGFYVCMKGNSLMSHEIDAESACCALIKDIEMKPYIHLFDKYFEISETTELEYILHFNSNSPSVKTLEMIADLVPIHNNLFSKIAMKLFILFFVKYKHEKHNVYFN